jgi:hypothetical protein
MRPRSKMREIEILRFPAIFTDGCLPRVLLLFARASVAKALELGGVERVVSVCCRYRA